jgi:hypothetical protein
MEISISAVTDSRSFSRAFIRVAQQLDAALEWLDDVSTATEPFDVIQVVFMDEPECYLEVEGTTEGSRIFQILAGLPRHLTFEAQDDLILASAMKAQVVDAVSIAIDKAPLSPETKSEVVSKLRAFRHPET